MRARTVATHSFRVQEYDLISAVKNDPDSSHAYRRHALTKNSCYLEMTYS